MSEDPFSEEELEELRRAAIVAEYDHYAKNPGSDKLAEWVSQGEDILFIGFKVSDATEVVDTLRHVHEDACAPCAIWVAQVMDQLLLNMNDQLVDRGALPFWDWPELGYSWDPEKPDHGDV